jgi:serine/threonine protein kinase
MPPPQATTYRTLRVAGFGAALAATVSAVPPHRPLEVDPFMLMVLAGLAAKTAGTLLDSRLKPHSLAIVTGVLLITALSGAALQVVRRPLVHPDVFILLALLGLTGMVPELRQPSWRRPRATPAAPDRTTVGDRWELVRPLPGADRGGFSDLWLGADLNRERRPVVVKLESGAPERKEESRKRLQREYGLLGGIQSRYVIDLHDGGRDAASGRHYIVLTRYPAGSLARRLEAASQLPLSWAVEVFAGILSGLTALHELLPHPIVHRDITPRNVLLRADGTPVLCDFGSARLFRRGDRRGDDQVTAGVVYSHYYAPPELVDQGLRDRWDPTPASDLYAAGSILYELLTGRPPYWREERGAQLEFARLALDPNLRPVPPTWVNPDLPPGIDELLARTLAFQPNDRPDSARDLLTQLHAIGPSEVDSHIPFAELRTAPIPVALGTTTTRSEL